MSRFSRFNETPSKNSFTNRFTKDRSFNSNRRQEIIKSKNCYLLPYSTNDKGDIFVFLITKKTFSSKDGWIHNNPGQITIVGGKNNQNERYSDAAIREFREEIGLRLNQRNITGNFDKLKYNCTFYKVNNMEDFLDDVRNATPEDEHIEVVDYNWYNLDDALQIMDTSHYLNNMPNINYENVNKYITNLKENENWNFENEGKEFKKYLKTIFFNDKLYNTIMYDIRKNGIESSYYDLFYSFLVHLFFKKGLIDYFENILQHISLNYNDFI